MIKKIDFLHKGLLKNRKDIYEIIGTNKVIKQIFLRVFYLISKWRLSYYTLEQMQNTDAIFAFSFGLGKNNSPGQINKALAYVTMSIHEKTSLPIFAQWEIAEELKLVDIKTSFSAYPKNGFLNTKGVIDQFLTHGKNQKIKKVIIVAHPDHQLRCGELLKKLGYKVYFPRITEYLPRDSWKHFNCDNFGYWKDSAQPWTTSRELYVKHEIYVRINSYYKNDL